MTEIRALFTLTQGQAELSSLYSREIKASCVSGKCKGMLQGKRAIYTHIQRCVQEKMDGGWQGVGGVLGKRNRRESIAHWRP